MRHIRKSGEDTDLVIYHGKYVKYYQKNCCNVCFTNFCAVILLQTSQNNILKFITSLA